MPTFREYFARKSADPEFARLYEQHCTVCRTTLLLVAEMHHRGMCAEDLGAEAGCDPLAIRDLERAERCSFEVVERLCRALDVEVPERCALRKRDD
jgi:DNA-binding Xre family transcriptional regulator